jgi:hypothetical protein
MRPGKERLFAESLFVCEGEIVPDTPSLSFPRRRESGILLTTWIPAFAGMTNFRGVAPIMQ